VISSPSKDLGLGRAPFEAHHILLQDMNLTMASAMGLIMGSLSSAQDRCARDPSCMSMPRTRCVVNRDRWDLVEGEPQERYHAPHCNEPWEFKQGEVFTVVSWHKRQLPKADPHLVWMHTILYGLFTATEPKDEPVPQAMLAFPTEFLPMMDQFRYHSYAVVHHELTDPNAPEEKLDCSTVDMAAGCINCCGLSSPPEACNACKPFLECCPGSGGSGGEVSVGDSFTDFGESLKH